MAARRAKTRVRQAKEALYRELVLDGALRVFARKGYEDAKMEEIAQAAGLSLGTVYSVFAGKTGIFRAIHEAADAELLRRATRAARDAGTPVEALLAGVRAYTRYFLERPDFLRLHLREGLAWGSEDAGAGSRERTAAWRDGVEMLATAYRRCVEAGAFVDRPPRLMARMMIAMQQVELAHWLEDGMTRAPDDVVREMEDQVTRSFRRDT